MTRACSHKRSTPVLRRIFRITSLIFLEIHQVFLRKIASFCEKSASQSGHFDLCEQALKKSPPMYCRGKNYWSARSSGKENIYAGEENTQGIYVKVCAPVKWKRDIRRFILKLKVRFVQLLSLYIILSYFFKKSTIITKL